MGNVTHIQAMKRDNQFYLESLKGKLWRLNCRLYGNTKMDLKETGYENVNCVHVALEGVQWQAFVKKVMNVQVTQKCMDFRDQLTISISERTQVHGVGYVNGTNYQLTVN
jgi:hypothetical protein